MQTITPLPDGRTLLGLSQLGPEQGTLLLLGHLAQGEGAQRGQVVGSEEVHQGRSHLVGRVDPPLGDPLPQGVGRQVDQHHLVGLVQQPVREGLSDPHPGEVLHLVVELSRCWMFTVVNTSMPASSSSSTSCQRLAFRPPAWLVWASSSTRDSWGSRSSSQSVSISANGRPPTLAIRLGATSCPAARSSVARRPCGSR
jgi:hypothetical protein